MSECTRSHPHENMDCCCEHKTQIARLTNHLATITAERDALKERIEELEQQNEQLQDRMEILVNALKIVQSLIPRSIGGGLVFASEFNCVDKALAIIPQNTSHNQNFALWMGSQPKENGK